MRCVIVPLNQYDDDDDDGENVWQLGLMYNDSICNLAIRFENFAVLFEQ